MTDSPLKNAGFTLLDLLLALSISALLVLAAVPLLGHFRAKQHLAVTAQTVFAQMQAARVLAVTLGKPITLCGSRETHRCQAQGANRLLAFIDANHNQQRDDDELLLAERSLRGQQLLVLFEASAHRSFFQYFPDGSANPYGSIYLCPQAQEYRSLAQRLVLSFNGRNRQEAASAEAAARHCREAEAP